MEDLHRERAELAALESEAADAMKYTRVGGFWWRVLSWCEREARRERHDVENELEARGYPVIRHDDTPS